MVDKSLLDAGSAIPLYQQLVNVLRQRIESGEYLPRQRLPSERDIAASHGISRPTVRQALTQLISEGYLDAQQGRGTFVALNPPLQMSAPGGLHSAMDITIHDGYRLLRFNVLEVPQVIELALPIAQDDKAIFIERLLLAHGIPVGLEKMHLAFSACGRILNADLKDRALEKILAERCDVYIHARQQWLEAAFANVQELHELGLQPPFPMLVLHRLGFRKDQKIITYQRLSYRGDWHERVAQKFALGRG